MLVYFVVSDLIAIVTFMLHDINFFKTLGQYNVLPIKNKYYDVL